MRIHSLRTGTDEGGASHLLARVGDLDVHYTVSGAPQPLRLSYDPFVLAGFLKAMEKDGRLTVDEDGPVSRALIENLNEASWIYTQWWPDLTDLTVEARQGPGEGQEESRYVGSFFSGGVDSLFSYLEHRDTITHLILCRGLDISFEEVPRWEQTVAMVRKFAEAEGKGLVLIETNVKKLQRPPRGRNHGAILVSTGLGLGFFRLIVPASVTLDFMNPYGSHPMLDPLFGNGSTEVVHDSPIRRSEKLEGILDAGIGLDQLRVCNVFTDQVNCGACEKCLRTRTALTLLGGRSPHLEPIEDPRILRNVRLRHGGYLGAWEENLVLARKAGRKDFAREIRRTMRRLRTREALLQLDEDYLGGAFLRIRRRLQGR
jgi:hypothetical protein